MRVLLLSNAITPDRSGGLERYVRELGGALSKLGADVRIVARQVDPGHPARTVDPDGVEIWRFPTPSRDNPLYALGYPVAAARAVREAVRDAAGTRVIHSHFGLQGLPLAIGRTRYLHTFHAPAYRELLAERQGSYRLPQASQSVAVGLVRRCESRVLRRAESVVVLSDFMRAEAVALGADADRIGVLPGGIDVDRFSPGEPVEHPFAKEHGPLLFTARRFVPRTGVTELVEAFAEIVRDVPGARMALAGSGPLEAEIRARVETLGLAGHVRMLGRVSDDDLVGWYRAADLVVMPTQELEGFGLTSAEAMACGTPVVGTPAGANPEVLNRLDRSLVTRDPSPPAIAEAVTGLLREPDRIRELSARARGSVSPAFSWGSIADGYMALYERHSHARSSSSRAAGIERSDAAGNQYGRTVKPSLLPLLRSPVSGEPLVAEPGTLRTADRREAYPVTQGIPIMLRADGPFPADAYSAEPGTGAGLASRAAPHLRRLLPSLSHNLRARQNFAHLRDLLSEAQPGRPSRVLVVGGAILGEGMAVLAEDPQIELLEADVAIGPRTDVICDAHALPFPDDAFDGVVCPGGARARSGPRQTLPGVNSSIRR